MPYDVKHNYLWANVSNKSSDLTDYWGHAPYSYCVITGLIWHLLYMHGSQLLFWLPSEHQRPSCCRSQIIMQSLRHVITSLVRLRMYTAFIDLHQYHSVHSCLCIIPLYFFSFWPLYDLCDWMHLRISLKGTYPPPTPPKKCYGHLYVITTNQPKTLRLMCNI